MLDQHVLAAPVAGVLSVDLGDRDVALVDDDQVVVREVVQQRVRRVAGLPPVQVDRVVLDAGARADLAHHLHVVAGPHPQPLRLEHLALALELAEPFLQLDLDAATWRPSSRSRSVT